jgi:hypothetical protein
MTFARPRGVAALLSLAVATGAATGAVALGAPALADGTPPAGTYSLDTTGIWAEQRVTLTERSLTDDSTPADAIARTVAWGDGSTEVLPTGTTTLAHSYAAPGAFTVSVTLSDGGSEAQGTFTTDAAVKVTTPPNSAKLAKSSVWTWENGSGVATLLLSGNPGNADRVWVEWGDGKTSLLGRTVKSTTHRYPVGTFRPAVRLDNKYGKAAAKPAGAFTVKVDRTNPSVSLKVPGKPAKASSWKTIQGTAKDGQIGMDVVTLVLWKWNNTTEYYYNFKTRKWVKHKAGTRLPDAAVALAPVSSKGAWKVSTKGASKGYYFEVDYMAWDKAGNHSANKYYYKKITG